MGLIHVETTSIIPIISELNRTLFICLAPLWQIMWARRFERHQCMHHNLTAPITRNTANDSLCIALFSAKCRTAMYDCSGSLDLIRRPCLPVNRSAAPTPRYPHWRQYWRKARYCWHLQSAPAASYGASRGSAAEKCFNH